MSTRFYYKLSRKANFLKFQTILVISSFTSCFSKKTILFCCIKYGNCQVETFISKGRIPTPSKIFCCFFKKTILFCCIKYGNCQVETFISKGRIPTPSKVFCYYFHLLINFEVLYHNKLIYDLQKLGQYVKSYW